MTRPIRMPSSSSGDTTVPSAAIRSIAANCSITVKRQASPVTISGAANEDVLKRSLAFGAHDYVTKPFNTAELLARLRVALRHAAKPEGEAVFQSGHLVADLANRRVTVRGITDCRCRKSAVSPARSDHAAPSIRTAY